MKTLIMAEELKNFDLSSIEKDLADLMTKLFKIGLACWLWAITEPFILIRMAWLVWYLQSWRWAWWRCAGTQRFAS